MNREQRESIATEEREEQPLSTADVAEALGNRPVEQKMQEHPTGNAPLLPNDRCDDFRRRWDSIQTSFVDEPKQAVEKADSLVAELMQDLAKTFSTERQNLESQWGRGDNVSTEDLRIALQRYRSFFSRLLSV